MASFCLGDQWTGFLLHGCVGLLCQTFSLLLHVVIWDCRIIPEQPSSIECLHTSVPYTNSRVVMCHDSCWFRYYINCLFIYLLSRVWFSLVLRSWVVFIQNVSQLVLFSIRGNWLLMKHSTQTLLIWQLQKWRSWSRCQHKQLARSRPLLSLRRDITRNLLWMPWWKTKLHLSSTKLKVWIASQSHSVSDINTVEPATPIPQETIGRW